MLLSEVPQGFALAFQGVLSDILPVWWVWNIPIVRSQTRGGCEFIHRQWDTGRPQPSLDPRPGDTGPCTYALLMAGLSKTAWCFPSHFLIFFSLGMNLPTREHRLLVKCPWTSSHRRKLRHRRASVSDEPTNKSSVAAVICCPFGAEGAWGAQDRTEGDTGSPVPTPRWLHSWPNAFPLCFLVCG